MRKAQTRPPTSRTTFWERAVPAFNANRRLEWAIHPSRCLNVVKSTRSRPSSDRAITACVRRPSKATFFLDRLSASDYFDPQSTLFIIHHQVAESRAFIARSGRNWVANSLTRTASGP